MRFSDWAGNLEENWPTTTEIPEVIKPAFIILIPRHSGRKKLCCRHRVPKTHGKRKRVALMVKVKKAAEGGGAPNLDILAARVRVVEAELYLEEKEVKLDNGRSFMAEPNLNLKLEVVRNLVDPGHDEGVKFYDRFKLKKDDDGDWTFAKYSKLGNLIKVRYGES